MKEKWKYIRNNENYKISNYGRVKDLINNKILIGRFDKLLYHHVRLGKKRVSIHRLVGQAFLGLNIEDSKMFVCHRDDDPSNNNKDNLFLGTALDNNRDRNNKGRSGKPLKGKLGGLSHISKEVNQFTLEGNFIKTWGGVREAGRHLGGVNVWTGISKCCRGELKTSMGFMWNIMNEKITDEINNNNMIFYLF